MNLIPVIREALGLQENEEFSLINPNEGAFPEYFRFTSNTLQIHYPQGWEEAHGVFLRELLRGDLKVAKLSFKPKENETYYFVYLSDGDVYKSIYRKAHKSDRISVNSGNCYRTPEEAEKHVDEWMSKIYGENWKELLK